MDKQKFIKYSILLVMLAQLFMIIFLLGEMRNRQIYTTGMVNKINNYCLE